MLDVGGGWCVGLLPLPFPLPLLDFEFGVKKTEMFTDVYCCSKFWYQRYVILVVGRASTSVRVWKQKFSPEFMVMVNKCVVIIFKLIRYTLARAFAHLRAPMPHVIKRTQTHARLDQLTHRLVNPVNALNKNIQSDVRARVCLSSGAMKCSINSKYLNKYEEQLNINTRCGKKKEKRMN